MQLGLQPRVAEAASACTPMQDGQGDMGHFHIGVGGYCQHDLQDPIAGPVRAALRHCAIAHTTAPPRTPPRRHRAPPRRQARRRAAAVTARAASPLRAPLHTRQRASNATLTARAARATPAPAPPADRLLVRNGAASRPVLEQADEQGLGLHTDAHVARRCRLPSGAALRERGRHGGACVHAPRERSMHRKY